MAILAEYPVNNVGSLPSHYTTAQLWNRYRDRFLEVLATPELASLRDATARS